MSKLTAFAAAAEREVRGLTEAKYHLIEAQRALAFAGAMGLADDVAAIFATVAARLTAAKERKDVIVRDLEKERES